MKKAIKISLRTIAGLLILVTIMFPILIRFTDGEVSNGKETILFGYDEENKRWQINELRQYELKGLDGPYLIKNDLIYVDDSNRIISTFKKSDSLYVKVNNEEKDKFYVVIKQNRPSNRNERPLPEKLIAISDIEGNFNGFSSFLLANGVIDDKFNWIFGKNTLVLLGDFVDRGEDVMQVLWLIYKLEQQAFKDGGEVLFIIGNHEVMNFQGRFGYASEKYKRLAIEISGKKEREASYKVLFSETSFLGKWLRNKPAIAQVGDYIFVHGGLNPEILKYNLKLKDINRELQRNWDIDLYNHPTNDSVGNFLMGRLGPLWYRGMVTDHKYYEKIKTAEIVQLLRYYEARKIVVGHTIVDDISKDFEGLVIRIDVKHGKTKNTCKTRGLLIEAETEYKINDLGEKVAL